jgi:hypothetical protein
MKAIALALLCSLSTGFMIDEPVSIMGDWLLQETSTSGCFTSTRVVYKPDEHKMMHFSPPNRYTMTSGDTLVTSGTFELTPQKHSETPLNGLKLTLTAGPSIHLNLSAQPTGSTVYELTNNRLVIGTTLGTFQSRTVYARVQ